MIFVGRLRAARSLLAGALALGALALLAAFTEQARGACGGNSAHCFQFSGSQFRAGRSLLEGFQGAHVTIRADCLSIPPVHPHGTIAEVSPDSPYGMSADRIIAGLWVYFPHGNYIVAGQSYGYPEGAKPFFFWADQRPDRPAPPRPYNTAADRLNDGLLDYVAPILSLSPHPRIGGFHEHIGRTVPAPSTDYTYDIQSIGPDSWRVNAPAGGISTHQPGAAKGMAAGMSSTNFFAVGAGLISNMGGYDLAGRRFSGWAIDGQPGLLHAARFGKAQSCDKPPAKTKPRRPVPPAHGRHLLAAGFSRLAVRARASMLPAVTTVNASGPAVNAHPDQLANVAIARLAERFAASAGDASPHGVVALSSDRASAVATGDPGAHVDSHQAVDVVVMHGNFTARRAQVPPGMKPPRGRVLELILDARTGAVTDWSLTSADPPIGALGVQRAVQLSRR